MALTTPITKLFGIKHPVLLAGMAGAAGPELAAAVTNAGGLGSVGGVGFSPEGLRKTIKMLKDDLDDKNAPFGVDLLLPQVGGGARKTNKDYTGGTLPLLIDIIIEEKAALFICAVGVPPQWVVEKLHAAKIPIMNMIGAVKHAQKALDAGVDIICAQGGEGGGHTGDTPTSILLPKVVDAVRGKVSPLSGDPVLVVGAGGIFDGRGLASALSVGCSGVWIGTRFIASDEAGAGPMHKKRVVEADYGDTLRSTIFTGRPMRVFKTPYILDWEDNRKKEMLQMQDMGIPAFVTDIQNAEMEGGASIGLFHQAECLTLEEKKQGVQLTSRERHQRGVFLTGQCAGAIDDIKSAKEIVEEMVKQAAEQIQATSTLLTSRL
uniref:Nitronate monooxygenase domain-containing protein n=1 Tax=Noctiluca scintillans TaxID=2966 RepID=A0A7S1FHF0_NOCSC|mmetsp:Transcript_613/g.1635  ORF Transcript_613/g.1635 Transcript_613/m.1635 type:complete len:377 (+) Transcript_613:63-1193(+)